MSKPVISVEALSKSYRLGTTSRLQDLLGMGPKPLPEIPGVAPLGHAPENKSFWALDDLSFTVNEGEIVGIIGRNGAGKSTLLRILSRITAPTKGRARIRGRVSSLLEVGTGFHQELTGRENIYLNGAILGMRKREIDRKLEAIVSFAEMSRFIDTPVKFYSSGMYVRLAFAVAAHLEPEILLVDEVLAVGDYAFQQKCLEKTQDFAGTGRTVIFVSHNLGAISRICDRGIFLEGGKIFEMGRTSDVLQTYVNRGITRRCEYFGEPAADKPMSLKRAAVVAPDGSCRSEIGYHERTRFVIDYEVRDAVAGSVAIAVGTADQVPVFVSTDYDAHPERMSIREPGVYRTEVEIPERWLNTGKYVVLVYLTNSSTGTTYEKVEALTFDVMETGSPGTHKANAKRKGVLQPVLEWRLEKLRNESAA